MNQPETIRVMLVDDHAVVRSGLAHFLMAQEDLDLVGEAADGTEALRLCERTRPDVILMDLMMPRMDGPTATRAILARFPHIRILVLTSFHEDNLVQEALRSGAIGYLLKNVTAAELAHAIRAARQGTPTLAPEAAQALIHVTTRSAVPALGHDLTERERDVLAMMVKGWDNHKIADALIVSHSTVKFHVGNILSKLQATSRTEAVALAIQHHLIAIPN
jgi:NarL family two-component system response regulator LiaR